ncbi:MAG: hypothetical protein R6W96_08860 [Clostridia bacterium]
MMKPVVAIVKEHGQRPVLVINDQPVLPYFYSLTDCPGGRLSYEEYPAHSIRKFADAGVRLFQLDIWLDDMWKEDGSFDIGMARKQIRGITDICPEGVVFFRFHTTPPKWWNHVNPLECVEYADVPGTFEETSHDLERYLEKDNFPVKRHSYASEKWMEEISGKLVQFLRELSACPEGDHLAGIQPATGVYGENHYWSFVNNEPDVSEVMNRAFRSHLKEKYGRDFPEARVPGMEERKRTSDSIFRDPEKERLTVDYYAFQNQLVAESVVHFCRLVKENWPRPIVTGAFYGYYFSLFGRSATGGHLAEEIVLQSPWVDYLSAPQAYTRRFREIGGAGAARGLLDSARLNGKLWLDEMDQPTHRGTLLGGMPVYDMEKSLQILRRNILSSYVKGQGLWFYDFGVHNFSGWWNHPKYIGEIREMKKLLEQRFQRPYANNSDVLLVFDTKTFLVTAHNEDQDPVTDLTCLGVSYPEAFKSGAAFDAIYLSDLERADLDRYACIVFMNTFAIGEEKKAFILSHVLKGGRSIWWFFAPGYSNLQRNSLDFVESLTGMVLEKATETSYNVDTEEGFYGMGNIGRGSRLEWVLCPKDHDQEFGRYTASGKTAIGMKKGKDHVSWFFSLPLTTPDAFRFFFKKSGVHIYNENDDALLEGAGILAFHTKEGGLREINLKNGKTVSLDLMPSETLLMDSETGEILRRG